MTCSYCVRFPASHSSSVGWRVSSSWTVSQSTIRYCSGPDSSTWLPVQWNDVIASNLARPSAGVSVPRSSFTTAPHFMHAPFT